MTSIQDRTEAFDSLLAPYAVKHSGGLGRAANESEDSTRLRFQRDRGRIVHTQSFRRLKGKTQVFVGGGGDHYRTRLTHTLEVAGLSRDIARYLSLNEDLAECIALAHDLGHPPFGHAGESALNAWMQTKGSGFEHNIQSYRIVTVLEQHTSGYTGLNLNQEILDGLLKHSTPHDNPEVSEYSGAPHVTHSPSLEAQLVNLADEIAYTAHDCEDGLRSGILEEKELLKIALPKDAVALASGRQTSLRGSIIDILVKDLYTNTKEQLLSNCINTVDDVYSAPNPLVFFSDSIRTALDELREFLWSHMYNHPQVLERSQAGQDVLTALCETYEASPTEKLQGLANDTGESIVIAIKDYVAGMTDSYAFLQAEELGVLDTEILKALSQ